MSEIAKAEDVQELRLHLTAQVLDHPGPIRERALETFESLAHDCKEAQEVAKELAEKLAENMCDYCDMKMERGSEMVRNVKELEAKNARFKQVLDEALLEAKDAIQGGSHIVTVIEVLERGLHPAPKEAKT